MAGSGEGAAEGDAGQVVARPAATLVLVRDGPGGLETLLVRRSGSAGFVPGCYVFPGGVVDKHDDSNAAVERWDGLAPEEAGRRLGLAPKSAPTAIAYFVAAVRETFEETGLLLGRRPGTDAAPQAAASEAVVRRARAALLDGRQSFAGVLRDLEVRIDGAAFAYIARWVTPPSAAKRYDTRFFAAVAPRCAQADPDEREATHAAWIAPARALALRAEGRLPMIRPTADTLEDCTGFRTAAELLSHLRARPAVKRAPEAPLPEERAALDLPEGDG